MPPLISAVDLDGLRVVRRLPGRNRTKADHIVYATTTGCVAVKDYGPRPWLIRQTLGRSLIGREARAYSLVDGLSGLVRFRGRLGPFALATQWIEGRTLSEFADGTVDPVRFDELLGIVEALHDRGVALTDLNHRDVLLTEDGGVYVLDLATAWTLGRRPGRLRRKLFERFCASDLFALARLRARFTGEDPAAVIAAADPKVLAWHRRARRIKWCWDRLRGAPRLPPVNDHWRF